MRKIFGKALLSYPQLSIFLIKLETVLNLHQPTYVYSEIDPSTPLTPMHFLKFGKEMNIPINFADLIDHTSKRSSDLRRKKC